MNGKLRFSWGILLVLATLLAGCATPQAAACPTGEPQSCPPTAVLGMTEMTPWRYDMAAYANAVITFEAGDKATLQISSTPTGGDALMIDVVANDSAYQNYGVMFVTLPPGKTLEDLKKVSDPFDPLSWVQVIGGVLTTPMSRMMYTDSYTVEEEQGPIYFICMVEGPAPLKVVGYLGPLNFTGSE